MRSFIAVLAFAAAVTAHGATSYQNNNLQSYGGGYGHGGWDHGHGHSSYKYEYGVKDSHTGDNKDAWEHGDGHHVKGGYKLKEADGTLRVVEYHAGPHGGINMIVKRIGHAAHPSHYGHGGHGGWGGAGAYNGGYYGGWNGGYGGYSGYGGW